MITINKYIEESKYHNIDYSDEAAREYRKKRYVSNNYYWYYVGKDGDYTEMPEHVFVWNKHHPHARLNPKDGNLIHHKDGNKKNNAPSNLERKKKTDHDRDHLTKRRKQLPKKFSKETASKGGKNAHKLHPELKDNLTKKKKLKESSEVVNESIFIFINISILARMILFYIISLIIAANELRKFRPDPEASKKLTELANDGTTYSVRFWKDKMVNAFAYTHLKGANIVYTKGIKDMLSEDELYAVLLHEAGHIQQKKQHIVLKTLAANNIPILICVNAFIALIQIGAPLASTIILILIMRYLSDLIPMRLSRYFEYDADSYVIKYGYEKHMISVLKKFEALDENTKNSFISIIFRPIIELFRTHPTNAKRIEALLKKAELYKLIAKGKIINSIKYACDFLNVEFNDKMKKSASLLFNKLK